MTRDAAVPHASPKARRAWLALVAVALLAFAGAAAPGSASAASNCPGVTFPDAHGDVGSGYVVSDFVVNFPSTNCNGDGTGPIGLTFDAQGNFWVNDYSFGNVYRFGPTAPAGGWDAGASVGSPSGPSVRTFLGHTLTGMTLGKDGRLYQNFSDQGLIAEVDTSTGAILRTFGSGGCGLDLATDPLSGDLFATSCGVGRITNPASASPGTASYAGGCCSGIDGLAMGPDGTLYGADGGYVSRIDGTNKSQPPAVTQVSPSIGGLDGLGVGVTPQHKTYVLANTNFGTIDKVDLSTSPATVTEIVSGGSRGDFARVGPDGCLYVTQSDRILKVTKGDLSCDLTPIPPCVASADHGVLCVPFNHEDQLPPGTAFQWRPLPTGQGYALRIGTTQGGSDLLNVTGLPQPSAGAMGSYPPPVLPSGPTLWARLYTKVNGVYGSHFDDVQFTAAPAGSQFTAPTDGQTGVDPHAPITWTTDPGVQGYLLRVGTTRGASNLLNVTLASGQHSYAPNLPPGQTLWARLYTKEGGVYGNRYQDISFTTAGAGSSF